MISLDVAYYMTMAFVVFYFYLRVFHSRIVYQNIQYVFVIWLLLMILVVTSGCKMKIGTRSEENVDSDKAKYYCLAPGLMPFDAKKLNYGSSGVLKIRNMENKNVYCHGDCVCVEY